MNRRQKATIIVGHRNYCIKAGSADRSDSTGEIFSVKMPDGSVRESGAVIAMVAIPDETTLTGKPFKDMSGKQQLEYLKNKFLESENMTSRQKGRLAIELRRLRGDMKLKYLFDEESKGGDRNFMNTDLRDFLNLKEDGTMDYSFRILSDPKNGWKEASSIGAGYHQNTVSGIYLNAKFTKGDGREVVFKYDSGGDHEIVVRYPDKGTFNYVDGNEVNSVLGAAKVPVRGHHAYDVLPYKELMDEKYSTIKIFVNFYRTTGSINKGNSTFWTEINENKRRRPWILRFVFDDFHRLLCWLESGKSTSVVDGVDGLIDEEIGQLVMDGVGSPITVGNLIKDDDSMKDELINLLA